MRLLRRALLQVLLALRLRCRLPAMKVTKGAMRNRIQTSSLCVWTAPTILLTSRLVYNRCTFIPCSFCTHVYSCFPRPSFVDDTPFIPDKRKRTLITASHLKATTSSVARRARVKNAASRPPPAIVRSPPSHQLNLDSPLSVSTADPDYDIDDESDAKATDDEYVPSPALGPLKRRPNSSTARKRPAKMSAQSTSQARPTKRARGPPPSRNKQVISAAAIEMAVTSQNPTFVCPECGWNQTNQRLPDFKRHLLTHTRSSENTDKGWWCKGVLVKDAAHYRISKTSEKYLFRNEWRLGGCLRTFSRRDALKRHLDNSNVACVGRPCEAAEEF